MPCKDLPVTRRTFRINFSLVSQIDGLSAKCLGAGARIERDVLAPSDAASVAHIHGHPGWFAPSSCCGFYFCDFSFMPKVVVAVASQRGLGIFVVPVSPQCKPVFMVKRKNPDGSGVIRRYGWFDYLMSKALLSFDLPRDAFTDLNGVPIRHKQGIRVVVAQFGQNGALKSRVRPEKSFRLSVIPSLVADGPKLGVRPVLMSRVSHLATDGP